tara:strand:- start:15 stop:353 length:339 start_codon:yes stop_codon:yes gene_type:complete
MNNNRNRNTETTLPQITSQRDHELMQINTHCDLRKGREHIDRLLKFTIAMLEQDPDAKCHLSWYLPYKNKSQEFVGDCGVEHIKKWWADVDKNIDWSLYGEGQTYEPSSDED